MALDLTLMDKNENVLAFCPVPISLFEELFGFSEIKDKKYADIFDNYYKDIAISLRELDEFINFLSAARTEYSPESGNILDDMIKLCHSAKVMELGVHFLAD